MLRKFMAIILFLIGIIGLAISVAGVYYSRQVLDDISGEMDQVLRLASDGLDTVVDTLILTKTTVEQANNGLDTVGITADTISTSLRDTSPMLDTITEVTTSNIPDSIESIENAIPNIAEAAGAIDEALIVLNAFQAEREIFGVPIRFDLGLNYNPTAPLGETVLQLGDSLEGVPEDIRSLEGSLIIANENLEAMASNVDLLADDLAEIQSSIDEVQPLLDDYIALVTESNDLIRQTRANLDQLINAFSLGITVLFVWIGVNQLVPLFLSWEIWSEDRGKSSSEKKSQRNAGGFDPDSDEEQVIENEGQDLFEDSVEGAKDGLIEGNSSDES